MTGYDVAIVGAGSVGLPAAYFLAGAGVSVGVFDGTASAGRGEHRAAIGGIRATHSEPAKATLCRDSLGVFASWEEHTGDDIEWRRGGYVFVAYRDEDEAALRSVVEVQRAMGLDISYLGADRIAQLVPGIVDEGLLGGTHSPGDGMASPLACAHSFRVRAEQRGAVFHFSEPVIGIDASGGRIRGLVTSLGRYEAGVVINAGGASAAMLGAMVGVDLPVVPDAHEAGITEPVDRFLEPLVVDLRPGEGSKNIYFYQNRLGQVIFCLTPDPLIVTADRRSTSVFLPAMAQRLVALLPRLASLKVRRTWRGLYPSTPDGSPLIGWAGPEGFLVAAGMCGQGFMLGPGVGRLLTRMVTGATTIDDEAILTELAVDRSYAHEELLT